MDNFVFNSEDSEEEEKPPKQYPYAKQRKKTCKNCKTKFEQMILMMSEDKFVGSDYCPACGGGTHKSHHLYQMEK